MRMIDMFCGAGGTSTGAVQALQRLGHEVDLLAINHWDLAIASHKTNHPWAGHVCKSIDQVNPYDAAGEGKIDLLWASPSCTHFSRARGGKPIAEQGRVTAWAALDWIEALQPDVVCIENVEDFLTWGPVDAKGKKIKKLAGKTFRAWLAALRSYGYRVDWKILVAADYGDPTTRARMILQAVRGRRKIVWPNPTHTANPQAELYGTLKPWRTARDIIDWSHPGNSIFTRKKPLRPNTLKRIAVGLSKYGIAPFIVNMEHKGSVQPVDAPLKTITTARGGAMAIIEPHLLPQNGGGALRPVSQPVPTVSTAGAIGLVEAFLVEYYGTGGAKSVDEPVPAITTRDRFGLVELDFVKADGQANPSGLPVVEYEGKQWLLDIRFRMLTPQELAAAQGFPPGYVLYGSQKDKVKQIGNAVPCNLARAVVLAAMTQCNDISVWLEDEAEEGVA